MTESKGLALLTKSVNLTYSYVPQKGIEGKIFLWFIYFLPKPYVLVLARIGIIFFSLQEGDGQDPEDILFHVT